ncbi:DUF4233 domain-containing protein [Agromyces albus]|uniref:DUF4233 domain-containing protein n=1 Tax=Agromyces albus TaxID=205332 RepID=UPI0027854922|nr:DUF4233 domain-containing protein [Agromyces albus]MDQ0575439.1 hypothetical protein [Agromyces albus]
MSEAAPAAAPRSLQQTLASIVLAFEVIVVFLASLVIWGLAAPAGEGDLPAWVALLAGGVMIVALIATIGLLRFRWAYALGWLIQALILAAGFLNPTMFVVGALFGGMWWYCMVVGARIDRARTAAADPGKEQE